MFSTQNANPHLAAVTPELKEWIIAQAESGVSAPTVLKAMLEVGWKEEVALAALESVLTQHLGQSASADGEATAETLPPAVPVPDMQLTQHPAQLDGGDRQVRVLINMQNPRVVVLDNVLSPQECEQLIAAARPRMKRSLTVDNKSETGGDELNADRTSEGMFFERGENDIIKSLEARIAHLLDWPIENGEGMQVLHYGPGAEYKPHYDYFEPDMPSTSALLRRGGQRVGTFLIYLNTPPEGGGTTFPNVGLEVIAQQGMAVFFSYDKPHPSTMSLHGGAPVISGEKWVATKWLREGEFT